MEQTHQDQLEQLVDAYGIADVLGILMEICAGKAEHLRVNWQDDNAAKCWDKCSRIIDKATDNVLRVS